MKEYGIYERKGSGTPYMIHFYSNIDSAKLKLYEIIGLEEERQRPYFVDNDFFLNKYNVSSKLKYYCIKEREVSEWEKYSEEKVENENDNKILYFLIIKGGSIYNVREYRGIYFIIYTNTTLHKIKVLCK